MKRPAESVASQMGGVILSSQVLSSCGTHPGLADSQRGWTAAWFIYLFVFFLGCWFVVLGSFGCGGVCSSAGRCRPGSGDGQMGYESTFKSFQPWCDASSKNFCHHAQCITLQLSVCPSPTAPGVRAATAAKPTCVHGSQSCLWDRCFPLCWSLWLEAEAPVVIKHRLHQPVGLLWI